MSERLVFVVVMISFANLAGAKECISDLDCSGGWCSAGTCYKY